MNLSTWMRDIDDSRDVFGLNLVGTHDCVTQYVQLSYFAKCQDKSIYEQLNMGIRCLDIRVKSNKNRLSMVHGICNTYNKASRFSKRMDMADVLTACYNFLSKNPSETIVFQFKNDSGREMEKCFDILYNEYISKNSDSWYLENRAPVLKDCRGKIVLIRRCKCFDNKPYSLGKGIDFSHWVEQDKPVPKPLVLTTGESGEISFLIQDRFKYKPREKWDLCVKPMLDDDACEHYKINYLSTAGGLLGPYRNSQYINPKFMEYELKDGKYYGALYTDFPTAELIKKVIKTNFC